MLRSCYHKGIGIFLWGLMNIFRIFTFGALLMASMVCNASSVNISPTSLRASDATKAQVLTLSNNGKAPVTYQFQIYTWSLVDGKDVLVPTNEVVASPRIVEIAPKAKQVIRIVKPSPAHGKATYYRAIARELPSASKLTRTGISNPINHSLPVSFEPANATAPVLSLKRQGQELAITNTGGTAARVSQVATPQGTLLAQGALGWALPGAMKLVPIRAFEGFQLVLTVNGKPQTLSVE